MQSGYDLMSLRYVLNCETKLQRSLETLCRRGTRKDRNESLACQRSRRMKISRSLQLSRDCRGIDAKLPRLLFYPVRCIVSKARRANTFHERERKREEFHRKSEIFQLRIGTGNRAFFRRVPVAGVVFVSFFSAHRQQYGRGKLEDPRNERNWPGNSIYIPRRAWIASDQVSRGDE